VEQEKLSIGTVISRVVSIYSSQASVWVPVSVLIIGLPAIVAVVLEHKGGVFLSLLANLVVFVATFIFTGMVVEMVAAVQEGRTNPRAAELIRSVMPVLAPLIGVSIVAGIGITVGFLLIIIPGLILLTIWAVFVPVLVLENPGGLKSLSRSRDLVRGHGWQVFGVIVIVDFVLALVVGIIVGAIAVASLGAGIVVGVVVHVLIAPVGALAAAVMYFELKRIGGPRVASEPLEPIDVPPGGIPDPAPADRDY